MVTTKIILVGDGGAGISGGDGAQPTTFIIWPPVPSDRPYVDPPKMGERCGTSAFWKTS